MAMSGKLKRAARRPFDRLGFRMVVVLAIALLPLMIVSILRSQSVMEEALARSRAALVGETLRALQNQVATIEHAKAVAQSLTHLMPELLEEPEACNEYMAGQLEGTPFSYAGFYTPNGYSPCSSAMEPFSFEITENLTTLIADPRPMVLLNENPPISGSSIIYASHPVFTEDGGLLGFTAVSVPHVRLRSYGVEPLNADFLTFNTVETILTASDSLDDIPSVLPRLQPGQRLQDMPGSFRAVSGDGTPRIYAKVPLVDGELYALGTWIEDDKIRGEFYLQNPALFPALMWLASLAVAGFASSLLVTRHVINLRKAMNDFGEDRRIVPIEYFDSAPAELRDVGTAFVGMTDTILHDEAQIEDALRQKDVLLREVHHRVKNNLQLIASIMSMQMRESRTPEVQRMIKSLHDRVNSLATIHRNLYQTTGQADVKMDEHLETITRQVLRMGAGSDANIDLQLSFDELRLDPDLAVPLSLFVTEALTNALKYIGKDGTGATWLKLQLKSPATKQMRFVIQNSLPVMTEDSGSEKSSGLGSELMEAFAEQLDGTVTRTRNDESYKVVLEFTVE